MNSASDYGNSLKIARSGQSLGEYAMIAGLILAICIPALALLGTNINYRMSDILGTYSPKSNPAIDVTAPSPTSATLQSLLSTKAPSGFYKGTGYYTVMLDPITGKPVITSTQTSQIDVSGSNGNLNTLGTVLLAKQLEQLALQQTDPALKDYYGQMAKLSYYMGAAEGELDDVSAFDVSNDIYSNGDALQDVYNYHKALLSMMQNPPANANPQQLQEVLPLATEVFNIGHNYVNHLSQFIDANGTIAANFDINGGKTGSGPGSVLIETTSLTGSGTTRNTSLEQMITYDKVKQMAVEVVSDYRVESQSVKTTMKDAQIIDTHSITKKEDD